VSIDVFILRREDPEPDRRWVIAVRFRFDFQTFSDDAVSGDATEGRRRRVRSNLDRMRALLPSLVEAQRNRIGCLLQLAEANDLGFTDSDALVYLDPMGVALFIDMSEARKAGELMRGVPPPRYRVNPVLELLLLIPEGASDEVFLERARTVDLRILESLRLWLRAIVAGVNTYGHGF